MGALYRLGQRFVDFCKMTQNVTQDEDSVPSNKAVSDALGAVTNVVHSWTNSTNYGALYKVGNLIIMNMWGHGVANGETITNIPQQFAPPSGIVAQTMCIQSSGKISVASLAVSSTGTAVLNATEHNEPMYGVHIVWIYTI